METHEHRIGVVGGMGPYAGLDLLRKIFDNTVAVADHQHLPVILASLPSSIPDRTSFLKGESDTNPGTAIANIILTLENADATVAGIPCNTAHAPAILDKVLSLLDQANSKVRLLNMIEETAVYISTNMPDVKKAGLLCTSGTLLAGTFEGTMQKHDIEIVYASENHRNNIQRAIYDADQGIKSQSNPISEFAAGLVTEAALDVVERGAQTVILGCTELPLAAPGPVIAGVPAVDTTSILARALIRETYPERLRPENSC